MCYATANTDVATATVQFLEAHDVGCWIAPRNITPGSEYANEIVEAVESASVVVFLMSKESLVSQHCRAELELAKNQASAILPVRMDESVPSGAVRYYVSTSQWLDARRRSMPSWRDQLLRAIRDTSAVSAQEGPHPRPQAQPLRTRRALIWLLVLAGLVCIAVAALYATRRGDGEAGVDGSASRTSIDTTSTSGVVAERQDPAILLFEKALNGMTPWSNDLAELTGDGPIDEPENEAALLGAWYSLADWCTKSGYGRVGVCYDKAAIFLHYYFERDPRTLNTRSWGAPGAIGSVVALGYETTSGHLGNDEPAPRNILDQSRPGQGPLCEPDCSTILD